jgi:hypothetical protein
MENPTRHHYFVKLLSSNWCKNDGLFYLYSSEGPGKWRLLKNRRSPKSVGFQFNLNTLKSIPYENTNLYCVENYWKKEDNKIADLIQKLIVKGVSNLTGDEDAKLTNYLNGMAFRHPEFLKKCENEIWNLREEFPEPLKKYLTQNEIYNQSRILPISIYKNCETWPFQKALDSDFELYITEFPFVGNFNYFMMIALSPKKLWVYSLFNEIFEHSRSLCKMYNYTMISNKKNFTQYLISFNKINFKEYNKMKPLLKPLFHLNAKGEGLMM